MPAPAPSFPPRPGLGTPLPYRFPVPRVSVLGDGLTVWAFDLPGQLVASADLVLPVPLGREAPDEEGVATLAARGCDEGTLAHPGIAFAEGVEGQGATSGASAGLWGTTVGLQVPAGRLAAALALLAEAVAEPAYAEADVARLVAARLTEIDQVLANPSGSAALALRAAVSSPDSRFSRPNGGRAATVAGLTDQPVRAFHDRWWTPRGAVLMLAGQLPAGIEDAVSATLGAWTPSAVAEAPAPVVPPTRPAGGGRAVWLIDSPEAVQADIRLGCLTPTRGDPSWAAAQIAGVAVGGSFGSRLNTVLRERRGFTYGAGCSFAPAADVALFTAQANCRVEVAAEAVRLALDLLDLSRAPLTATEVQEALAYLVGVAPLQYDTAEAIAAQAGALALAGLPAEWIDEHRAHLRAVTPEAANAAFTRWIDPAGLHVVIAGPAARLLEPLRAAGLDARVVDVTGRPV